MKIDGIKNQFQGYLIKIVKNNSPFIMIENRCIINVFQILKDNNSYKMKIKKYNKNKMFYHINIREKLYYKNKNQLENCYNINLNRKLIYWINNKNWKILFV